MDGEAAALENVGVDHGRLHVLVAQKLLDGSDVVSVGQQVGCEGMAQGVGSDVFLEPRLAGGVAHGALSCSLPLGPPPEGRGMAGGNSFPPAPPYNAGRGVL